MLPRKSNALVESYVHCGGSSLFVQKGWVGRLAAMNAAIWAGVMEMWLRQNPTATGEVRLAYSRKLRDARFRDKDISWQEDALARISQRGRCIGPLNLRKSCCHSGLSQGQGKPDADRV